MDYYKYLVKKLGEIVSEYKCDFIIYPFGERGALTKGILNGIYGVQEKAVIDNVLCDTYGQIENLEYLRQVNLDECKVLITSDRLEIYEELRENLYETVGKEYCIELFPVPPSIEISRQKKPLIIKKMQAEGVSEENPVYHPKHTKSDFYLPLLLTDFIQSTIFMSDDYYEKATLEKVFVNYESGIIMEKVHDGVVLDIGANIGNHALFFCNECGARKVYCFEPIDFTFSILEKNIMLNGLEHRVVLNRMGLGEREENCDAEYNVYNLGGTSLKQSESGSIHIRRLDDLEIREKISFIKIDVEGMESSVINGGKELISKNHPYIMVESFGMGIINVRNLLCEKMGRGGVYVH